MGYLDDAADAMADRIRRHERSERDQLAAKIRNAKARASAIIDQRNATPVRPLAELLRSMGARLVQEKQCFALLARGHAERRIESADPLVVEIDGTINGDMMTRAVSTLRSNPCAQRVLVMIDSSGGDPSASEEIFHVLVGHGAETKIALITRCHSAAILPALACRERFAAASASIAFHEMNWGEHCPTQQERICAAAYDVLETVRAEAAADMAPDIVQSLRESGRSFDAETAKELGFVDEIIDDSELAELLNDDVPRSYEITTIGGVRAELPLRADIVENVVAAVRSGKVVSTLVGLPSAYATAIGARLGLSGNGG